MHLHLEVEDLGLGRNSLSNELGVEELENVSTDLVELFLDRHLVAGDECSLLRALLPLLALDRANDAEGGTTRADHVLVRDREKVALLERQV